MTVVAAGNQRQMRPEHLFPNRADAARFVLDAVDEGREEMPAGMRVVREPAPFEQDASPLFARQRIVALDLLDRRGVDDRPREVLFIERIADADAFGEVEQSLGEL